MFSQAWEAQQSSTQCSTTAMNNADAEACMQVSTHGASGSDTCSALEEGELEGERGDL